MKYHEKCASDVQSEVDTTQEENTRFLDQANMMQKDNSDITGELSNMVANHAHVEKEILKLDTMASENIKSIEEMRKKNDKSMTKKAALESKFKSFHSINGKSSNELKNSSGQIVSFHINLKGLNNSNHQM